MDILLDDEMVSYAFDDVMNKWQTDFQELLTPQSPESNEQREFGESIRLDNDEQQSS